MIENKYNNNNIINNNNDKENIKLNINTANNLQILDFSCFHLFFL